MPDWDDKPQEERDTYGSAWVTEADSVDARRTEEVVEEVVEEQTKPLSLWADTWRRLKRNRLALVGLGIIIVFLCHRRGGDRLLPDALARPRQ